MSLLLRRENVFAASGRRRAAIEVINGDASERNGSYENFTWLRGTAGFNGNRYVVSTNSSYGHFYTVIDLNPKQIGMLSRHNDVLLVINDIDHHTYETLKDYGTLLISFLDESGLMLGGYNPHWVSAHLGVSWPADIFIPQGTTKIRMDVMGYRTGGTENSVYLGDIDIGLARSPTHAMESLYATLSRSPLLDGWTQYMGSGGIDSNNTSWGTHNTVSGWIFKVDSDPRISRSWAVSSLSAACQASIAAGTAVGHLSYYVTNQNNDDRYRALFRCKDALSANTDFGRTSASDPNNGGRVDRYSSALPADTETIELHAIGDRYDGSWCDIKFGHYYAHIVYEK